MYGFKVVGVEFPALYVYNILYIVYNTHKHALQDDYYCDWIVCANDDCDLSAVTFHEELYNNS